MMMTFVNNLPTNPNRYRYFTCRAVDGQVWFYGAWFANQSAEAMAQAREINGFVVENPYDEDGLLVGRDL